MPRHQPSGGLGEAPVAYSTNGNVRYPLKAPYQDGTAHGIFEPLDFVASLAARVPEPRVHLTRFHGVFVPDGKHRAWVTPAKRGKGNKARAADETQAQTPEEPRASMTWAQRLKRVFNIDVATCRECGGAVRVTACIRLQGKDCSCNPFAFPPSMAVRCRR